MLQAYPSGLGGYGGAEGGDDLWLGRNQEFYIHLLFYSLYEAGVESTSSADGAWLFQFNLFNQ